MPGIKDKIKKSAESNIILRFMLQSYRKLKPSYIRRLFRYIIPDIMRKRDKYCVICGHKVGRFAPYFSPFNTNVPTDIFSQHRIIGSDFYETTCPYCGSTARSRWQYYILKSYSGILDKDNCTILHFAAEGINSNLILTNKTCKYITADIEPGRCDIICDMTNLNMFDDNTFDYIIANHVMEHIQDESKAISELKRVLKHDGIIILSFPICTDMLTYEDPSITTEAGRWQAFGQGDHVRLYGTDFRERLENYGLSVKVYSPETELTPEEIIKYGFIKDDVSIFCTLEQ